MDIRDRVMGDQPNDFLHKIASIVPGYNGYVDRERRRDADKLLRTHLARQYTAQRDRLARVQQNLARGRHMAHIAEVDRLVGVLQRFTDRLNSATYGYTGLFDPVKIEAAELDQIYAFDMALTSGVEGVSAAVGTLEAAATPGASTETASHAGEMPEMPAAITRLSGILDDLNARLDQRADLISTGRIVGESEYRSLMSNLESAPYYGGSSQPGSSVETGYGGSQARVGGIGAEPTREGTPTTSFGGYGTATGAGSGIETASSPSSYSPGAAASGYGVGEGTGMSSDLSTDMSNLPDTDPPMAGEGRETREER